MKQKLFSIIALLLTAATGAWAEPIIVTWTSSNGSYDARVSYSNSPRQEPVDIDDGGNFIYEWQLEGNGTFTTSLGNFTKIEISGGWVNYGSSPGWDGRIWTGNASSVVMANNVTSNYGNDNFTITFTIESATPAATTYSVTMAEGTEEADKWTVKVGEGEAQDFPVEGLDGGETVTVTYSGEKKVKSVKAVKKAAGNAYLTWDADQKKLVATEIPTTAIKVENSTSYVEWSGTYVVEDDVTITGNITLSGNVNLIIKDGATLTANKIIGYNNNLSIYGQANQTGQLVVDNSGADAISSIKTLEVHSAKVTSSSSGNDRGGFFGIETFNVYGGSVDAENTAEDGGYGIGLKAGGFMNIFGGEVKAVGKGDNSKSNGINGNDPVDKATVTVYGGKLWAGNADDKALRYVTLTIDKSSFTGKIETCDDDKSWTEYTSPETPTTKYVRAGY